MSGAGDATGEQFGNAAWNRRYHDWYATEWRSNHGFRAMTGDRPGQPDVVAATAPIGTEWAPSAELDEVVKRFIVPHLDGAASVLEIGPGGGRVSRQVCDIVGKVVGLDVSARMLAEATAATDGRLLGVQTDGTRLPIRSASIDFAFAFDVLVHADLHVMFRLLVELARVLRPGGSIAIHTANLETSEGWQRFSTQAAYAPEAHFFVTPSTVRLLLRRAGFDLLGESREEPGNFYLERDYIAVARGQRS